jgi:hypothetical protein
MTRGVAASNVPAQISITCERCLGQCNIVETFACVDRRNKGKTPHWAFSVDDVAINRRM